ncbi:MAG TPA: squalene--hopene cyclase [bacterium]|nr:squalene--hopene cyclase [bacterium]
MDGALTAAVGWLLDHQHPDGWWVGELETNVTMTAEHVLLCRFLGIDLEPIREGAIRHILRAQREDGSWALYYEAPADLSTTIEAYAALKVLGVDPAAAPMRKALTMIRALGGVARARVFTKIWLALFGQYPWRGIPTVPPEMVYLPPSVPFNLYDFACWARGTIGPLTIVLSRRPVRPLGVDLPEIVLEGTEPTLARVPGAGPFWWLDKLLKLYESSPVKPGRNAARRRLVTWVEEHQEADGSWGGIQPPWVYSLIALNLEGLGTDHPVMRKGLEGMRRFSLEDESGWRFQACMSPVWDAAWALRALAAAGIRAEHPSVRRAVRWILNEQITGPGDWCVRCPDVPCGGWAFEFDNDLYPDIDDTAVVVVGLLECGAGEEARDAVERARRWVLAMRSRNGAWGAFDRDNTREIIKKLPFCDFGAVLDPPSEDVTAHVLEMEALLGADERDPHVAGGLEYLRRTQTPAGSWFGRWGVNYIYGTWCVVSALAALGTGRSMIDRAAQWLLAVQNPDGGWGETCYSYNDASFAGVGRSSPSPTAWAVVSLQLAGLGGHPACRRGVAFLRHSQTKGTWDEAEYTGTGFPRDFYINYHLYRHLFPTLALAGDMRYAGSAEAVPSHSNTTLVRGW